MGICGSRTVNPTHNHPLYGFFLARSGPGYPQIRVFPSFRDYSPSSDPGCPPKNPLQLLRFAPPVCYAQSGLGEQNHLGRYIYIPSPLHVRYSPARSSCLTSSLSKETDSRRRCDSVVIYMLSTYIYIYARRCRQVVGGG